MRSIKDISGVFCGEKLRIGRWYKIRLKRVCNGVECLVTLPDCEELEFSKCNVS